jgi:chromosomal replication initiator protein
MMTGRPIDCCLRRGSALPNVLRANQRRITIDEIQAQSPSTIAFRKAEMTSARRAREVARPRQVAMYLSEAADAEVAARHRPPLRRPRPYDR